MKKLILIGGGGHCKSVLDCLDQNLFDEIIISDRPDKIGSTVLNIPIKISDDKLFQLKKQEFDYAFITIGTIRADTTRNEIYHKLIQNGYKLINIISSSATVSENVQIEEGVFIGKQAVVNTGTSIACCAIINTGALIEHDCKIGAFTHIAPGCILLGNVQIGHGSHIGAGAVIKQGVCIGSNVTVGAGSVVLKDIPDNATAYGIPSKVVS